MLTPLAEEKKKSALTTLETAKAELESTRANQSAKSHEYWT